MIDLQIQKRLLYLEGYIRRVRSGGSSLPIGGATGQVLTKASALDNDVYWSTIGITPDGTFTVCDGTINSSGSIVGAFFELTEGAP